MKKALLCLVLITATIIPIAPASAAPAIEFLSPSVLYTGHTPELSDKAGIPVHLVAAAREVPSDPLVEFEVRSIAGGPLPNPISETVSATRAGPDTFEGFFTIPESFEDGAYTVSVFMYTASNTSQELASDDITVTINQKDVPPPAPAETVEITSPDNGVGAGFFTPKGARPHTIIQGITSAGARQVRVFYTLTPVGTMPVWKECGFGPVTVPTDATQGNFVARCTLLAGDSSNSVTAVAAVANTTPRPAEPAASADDGMDAHRVFPYVQRPAFIDVSPESVQQTVNECRQLDATVFDDRGAVIAGVNVDVHAHGPNDQLTFAHVDPTPVTNDTHAFQPPQQGHNRENAIRCSDKTRIETQQGFHRGIGAPDRHHIESVNGTNNFGKFVFALLSPVQGGSFVTVWADENDDDVPQVAEATGGARIGWGQLPPEPQQELLVDPNNSTATIGTCQPITFVVRQSGSPMSGVNVDVHAIGPDATISYCTPTSGGSTTRPPDQGGHTGFVDPSGSIHVEGETDISGRLVIGIMSGTEGQTQLQAWIDAPDDDAFSPSESTVQASVNWVQQGDRSISIDASRRRVPRGNRVRIFGRITGDNDCEAGQLVRIRARVPGGRFRTVARDTTDGDGDYRRRIRVYKTKDYRAVAPAAGGCERARSRLIRVRRA